MEVDVQKTRLKDASFEILLFCLFVLQLFPVTSEIKAQPPGIVWTRVYGHPNLIASEHLSTLSPEGDLVITAARDSIFSSQFSTQPFIMKIGSNGDSLWTAYYWFGNYIRNLPYGITRHPAGGYVLTGITENLYTTGEDEFFFRISEDGDTIRRIVYEINDRQLPNDIQSTPDSGFVLCGEKSSEDGQFCIGLTRTNSIGDTLWTRNYVPQDPDEDWGLSIDIVPSGGFIVAGQYRQRFPAPGHTYGYLWRINDWGDTVWTKPVAHTTYNVHAKVKTFSTPDGGFVYLGYVQGVDSFTTTCYLVKLDSQGTIIWERYLHDGFVQQCPKDMALVGSSGYLVGGWGQVNDFVDPCPLLIRVNTSGDTLWTLRLPEYAYATFQTIQVLEDGGYLLTGAISEHQFFVMRTEPDPVSVGFYNSPAITYSLCKIYPNPFNNMTNILFSIPFSERLSLRVYDLLGREVAILKDEKMIVGEYTIPFNASALPSGIYFCKLSGKDFSHTQKMVLMK
jgi:hypothetical protein